MNRRDRTRQTQVISALVEGHSIRVTIRMTGVSKPTVLKLLAGVGHACQKYQDRTLRDLSCKRIQCDEIWSFCYAKETNVPKDKPGQFGYGDVWTWTAICADTKLVPSWLVGPRNGTAAQAFMMDLASRLKNRVQISTDGNKVYLEAVEGAFWSEVDYAMLVKIYGADPNPDEVRYSPARFAWRSRRLRCKASRTPSIFRRAVRSGKTSRCG